MVETFTDIIHRISRHEAGHYIVGEANGFKMGKLRYLPGKEAGAEGLFIKPANNLGAVLKFIDQRAEVLLAGVLAETWSSDEEVWKKAAGKRFTEEGARQDKAKFAELLYLRQSIVGAADEVQHQNAIDEHQTKLVDDSAKKKSDNIDVVLELAEEFKKRIGTTNLQVTIERPEIEVLPGFQQRFLRTAG